MIADVNATYKCTSYFVAIATSYRLDSVVL